MLAVFAAVHQALVLFVGWRANVILLQLQIMESRERAHGDAV